MIHPLLLLQPDRLVSVWSTYSFSSDWNLGPIDFRFLRNESKNWHVINNRGLQMVKFEWSHSLLESIMECPFPCMQEKGNAAYGLWKSGNLLVENMFFDSKWSNLNAQRSYAPFVSFNFGIHFGEHSFPACRKRKRTLSISPQKWMTAKSEWPWGIQIGPFGDYKVYIPWINFYFFKSKMQIPFSCI